MEYLNRGEIDQLKECTAKIRQGHEAVEFNSRIVEKHGREAIKGALLAGQYLAQAELLIKGNEGWIKWCEKTFPSISYKTLSRYRDLHNNWTALSNEEREGCETLNEAYVACEINGGVERGSRNRKETTPRRSEGDIQKAEERLDNIKANFTEEIQIDYIRIHVEKILAIISRCPKADPVTVSTMLEPIRPLLLPLGSDDVPKAA